MFHQRHLPRWRGAWAAGLSSGGDWSFVSAAIDPAAGANAPGAGGSRTADAASKIIGYSFLGCEKEQAAKCSPERLLLMMTCRRSDPPGKVDVALARVLKPTSVAIVGLSDNSRFKDLVRPTVDSGAEVFFVNPGHDSVLGHPTVRTLSSLDRPIDVVMSFMRAERTTELVEEAAGLDVGGLVLVASGFAEMGLEGQGLQDRVKRAAAASGMAVVGPNGLGYVNVRHGISLTVASRHKRRPGGVSLVSQSGALLSGVVMAAWGSDGFGLNLIVSSGNEAVTDLADYVNYLAGDPETTAIGLVIEAVRRPVEFLSAVRRAVEAGKPVAALKLARNERSRRMAASHTAALAGDAWVYDVALSQAGVILAYDPEELVDRLALFDQIPAIRRTPVRKLGVVTMTGGFASLSLDLALAEEITVPPLESFADWVREHLPGITVPNPLDTAATGAPLWPDILDKYAGSDELDSLMVIHPLDPEDETEYARNTVREFARIARQVAKPCVSANCSGFPGSWVRPLVGEEVALGRGLRPTLRGLHSLGAFVLYRQNMRATCQPEALLARPSETPIRQPDGTMLSFDATMRLLESSGIPVAPYVVISDAEDLNLIKMPFAGPYAVKLADVAHRTEHDAVRLNVTSSTLSINIAELRILAAKADLPAVVAIQPMIEAVGEVLLGIQGDSEFGPLVVLGLGGTFAEALDKLAGRLAPISVEDARELIDEFRDIKLMHGFRGRQPWDLSALADIVVSASRLASAGREWIASLDVNPLIYGIEGFQAVDGLMILQSQNTLHQNQVAIQPGR